MKTYILDSDGRTPIPCDDLMQWAEFLAEIDLRRVALTYVQNVGGEEDIEISTVFFGIDYGRGNRPPLVFETMALNSDPVIIRRSSTWEEAQAAHREVVGLVKRDICPAFKGP